LFLILFIRLDVSMPCFSHAINPLFSLPFFWGGAA
jgi:hypothetical protein